MALEGSRRAGEGGRAEEAPGPCDAGPGALPWGVVARDVVLDERAEAFVELVIGAAERGEVLAVDKDWAVRRFAGPRQADADVRRLGFSRSVDHAPHDREGQCFHP